MPADLILDDDTIKLVDARIVRIAAGDNDSFVSIMGRLKTTAPISTPEIATGALQVGSGAPGEPRANGKLVVSDSHGEDLLRVQGASSTVTCQVGRADHRGVIIVKGDDAMIRSDGYVSGATLSGSKVETGAITIGQGAENEPREAGMLHMRNDTGFETVRMDAGGTAIEKPSIVVRWQQLNLRDVPDFRFRRRGPFVDTEEPDTTAGALEEVEIDLVEEVLFLRKAVSDLTSRLEALEGTG